jgi:CRISPR/Cas system CSM-associated protein Csm3 (group 7 of RAMP superfamily)
MAFIKIEPIEIEMQGALHIGAGYGRGLIDRAVVHDGRGQIYIPGSSLKGKVREACERLATTQGLQVCQPPYPQGMCGKNREPCIVCRIFGTPGRCHDEWMGLHWDNAYLTKEWQQAAEGLSLSYPRTQVGMSRRRGVAREGLLFTDEFTAEGLTFQTRISGHLPLTAVLDEPGRYYELILLLAGLKMVNALGGATSRGAGRCCIKLPEKITVKADDWEAEEIEVAWLLDRLELLELYKDQIEEAVE